VQGAAVETYQCGHAGTVDLHAVSGGSDHRRGDRVYVSFHGSAGIGNFAGDNIGNVGDTAHERLFF